jgi:hypothetical protein
VPRGADVPTCAFPSRAARPPQALHSSAIGAFLRCIGQVRVVRRPPPHRPAQTLVKRTQAKTIANVNLVALSVASPHVAWPKKCSPTATTTKPATQTGTARPHLTGVTSNQDCCVTVQGYTHKSYIATCWLTGSSTKTSICALHHAAGRCCAPPQALSRRVCERPANRVLAQW